ncbi:MAG: GNAT family N-acetyltransferase [Rubripirellula sp.]
MIDIQVTRCLDELLGNTEEWDSLSGGVPFRQSAWLKSWWECFGNGNAANVVIARESNGELKGILPLYRSGDSGENRTLTMIGGGDACSDYVSILVAPQNASEVATAMGSYLAQTAADPIHGWDLIDIDGVVEGDEPMAAFATGLREGGSQLHTQSRMNTWYVPRAESWPEQLKRYGKTQRRQMRRAADKIDADGSLEKLVARTEAEVEELLQAVIDMHQTRWEAEGEAGSYADQRFRDFIMNAAKTFARQDQLYLTCLRHEGRIVGGELNFLGKNRILYSYTSGYALDASELGPGRILRVDSFLQMYRENLEGIDYLRGDETYKQRMSSVSHPVMRLRAVAPALLPKLKHAAWCTGFEFKQWMRKKAGRTPIHVLDITSTGLPASTSESQCR